MFSGFSSLTLTLSHSIIVNMGEFIQIHGKFYCRLMSDERVIAENCIELITISH